MNAAQATEAARGGLQIRGLTVSFGSEAKPVPIVRGIDIDLVPGQITGLAGESGSGKSMTGLAMCGLLPAGARTGGRIDFDGKNLLEASERELERTRGTRVAMVFQDPTASLHPMLSIGHQLTDHLRVHEKIDKRAARARAIATLERVRVPDPETAIKKYPHQFSGGQLQRIAIAMAIICEPEILIADEPTTALDVTVQAGVLRLLRSLCDELGLAVLLITHDLGVMSSLADRISVMREGVIIEEGPRFDVLRRPREEYTRALVAALPNHEPFLDDEPAVGTDGAAARGTEETA
ncbi:peptide/nickel transport system ATP-binding protein [Leucobacter komagatae]|uniref:Peptide/nickel transport system ATP-binding protein n=1 Tax=Leucobacter komagatae TaxID=55969 RepID=A0A542Y8J4_9MICO|nr:ABC transporter ATP-binding protein [Leucobacter komagatae]TQL44399.1 peptide/nickel transport system ATP-binding protein [Leucobacter komagatae]